MHPCVIIMGLIVYEPGRPRVYVANGVCSIPRASLLVRDLRKGGSVSIDDDETVPIGNKVSEQHWSTWVLVGLCKATHNTPTHQLDANTSTIIMTGTCYAKLVADHNYEAHRYEGGRNMTRRTSKDEMVRPSRVTCAFRALSQIWPQTEKAGLSL